MVMIFFVHLFWTFVEFYSLYIWLMVLVIFIVVLMFSFNVPVLKFLIHHVYNQIYSDLRSCYRC